MYECVFAFGVGLENKQLHYFTSFVQRFCKHWYIAAISECVGQCVCYISREIYSTMVAIWYEMHICLKLRHIAIQTSRRHARV